MSNGNLSIVLVYLVLCCFSFVLLNLLFWVYLFDYLEGPGYIDRLLYQCIVSYIWQLRTCLHNTIIWKVTHQVCLCSKEIPMYRCPPNWVNISFSYAVVDLYFLTFLNIWITYVNWWLEKKRKIKIVFTFILKKGEHPMDT